MIFYIDNQFKCYTENDGTRREFLDVNNYFNNKCKSYIEGYKFIPLDESYQDKDGTVIHGESMFPWKNFEFLTEIQKAVEENDRERDAELASLIEEIYNEDLEVIG